MAGVSRALVSMFSYHNAHVVTVPTSLCKDLRGAREGIVARNIRYSSRTPLALIRL